MLTIFVLLINSFLLFLANSLNCPASYSAVPYSFQSYCIKCDTSCLTCTGPGINNCITCANDFTHDSQSSYCLLPSTELINTVQSSYKFFGFLQAPGWTGGTVNSTCSATILKGTTNSIIKTQHTLQTHYQLRLLVSLWWLDSASGDIEVKIKNKATSTSIKSQNYVKPNSSTNKTTSGSYQAYCDNSFATNIDFIFNQTLNVNEIQVQFTSSAADWGIRQYIFIQYLCNITTCSKCNGPDFNDCLECIDPNRELVGTECKCNSTKHYYKHPQRDFCVKPCPSYPTQQYYGDEDTKNCVILCPIRTTNSIWGLMFADDVTGECVEVCPDNISFGSIQKPLFYDVTNRKCVTNCPSTHPYSWWVNRTCYATCPTSYYKYQGNMSCVDQCPQNGIVPLFRNITIGSCVKECLGLDNWADFLTYTCTDTCSGTNYFQDNTTGVNICVQKCASPDYFGDLITNASQPFCVAVCPADSFGDTIGNSLRHCVAKCSGNYFGLQTGNRRCVEICPENTWGQRQNYTCSRSPLTCDAGRYADSVIHLCVDGGTCSNAMFSLNISQTCQITCPNGTYADENTHYCQLGCNGGYFADPGINKCVLVCFTHDLYADIDSNNFCVSTCHENSSTPFLDDSTKKCVNKCPDAPYYYADSSLRQCVYNCSIGLYADSSVAANKTCVSNCYPDYFGDNSTGYSKCVSRCPENPELFGDVVNGSRICVSVCQVNTFGDQSESGTRRCNSSCPVGWFSQDDSLRRCVKRCNLTTYGSNQVCKDSLNCPGTQIGDPYTNLCVPKCPESQGTFADMISKLCVIRCPDDNGTLYYADPTNRLCVNTCLASQNLFGNNATQTCEKKCIDSDSYADAQHLNRFCIEVCTDVLLVQYFRNNHTKVCVISINCPQDYFGDNSTQNCVAQCPIVLNQQTWGYIPTKTCIQMCFNNLWADISSGIALCISSCPSVPPKWSQNTNMTCTTMCPSPLFGQDFNRTCVSTCPKPPSQAFYTYSYDVTRRCLKDCPQTTFSDYLSGICWHYPENCTYGWGDDYNNSCVHKCTGSIPWDSYGDNETKLCTVRCSDGSYADNYTGTRICVEVCPGQYDIQGTPLTNSFDSFGDNNTQRCVLYCQTPNTWADWQTHRCESRCSGDDPNMNSTYSKQTNKRCVIALACPFQPDKLYGDNITRSCVVKCFSNSSYTEWADNITRTCLPQCLNTTNTRFYGDISTNLPICVIECPESPRSFGENQTNLCVSECPDNQYGDQTGNRTCLSICPVIASVMWFSQITQRICVTICENTTFGNIHNSHCETVPTDCIAVEYGDDSTHLCVNLCPESMNYFGDPSTKLCVNFCPQLLTNVTNVTANISMVPGYLYANYLTRLCVYKCPENHGLHGTFGDNTTHTCVQRCPMGSYGDSQTINRHCVANCTNKNFADQLTMRCVSRCPASPPYFGDPTTWICVQECPTDYWADSESRTCKKTCPNGSYRLKQYQNQCVNTCPSSPDLYADPLTLNCSQNCTGGKYSDPTDRTCKDNCLPLFQYDNKCSLFCPDGFYSNSLGNCVEPTNCDTSTFAQNRTTKCVNNCSGASYADPNSRYCIAVCPQNWFGQNNVCVQNCSSGNSASNITQLCSSACPKNTYAEEGSCVSSCSTKFANDLTGICDSSCPTGQWGDSNSHDCVVDCPSGYFRASSGKCVEQNNGCSVQFSDFISGNCTIKCSNGYWGNTGNHTCLKKCISGQYGYQTTSQRTCYTPLSVPQSTPIVFADPETQQFIPICHTSPTLYYGDPILKQCVKFCGNHSGTQYFGDPLNRQCKSVCTDTSLYTADSETHTCTLKCTFGTFRDQINFICVKICPTGYADSSSRICVSQCPLKGNTFGFYNISSTQRICLEDCPKNHYAQPVNRTCTTLCPESYFAFNETNQCVKHCLSSFAQPNTNKCVKNCFHSDHPNADNSTNNCVFKCPSSPEYYAQNNVCVFYCAVSNHYADPQSRSCVIRCPNVTTPSIYNSYADFFIHRCVQICSQGYWGDNSTNKCVKKCPTGSYADNTTRKCVKNCSNSENMYADTKLNMCAYTCSGGFFGSQINNFCIETCDDGYWGDPLTTLCTTTCPNKIYSYGQNSTRKCVLGCTANTGFADNITRLCVQKCQNTSVFKTFADPTSFACVQICPSSYFAENTTNECKTGCLTGFADQHSRFCVAQCPDDPQTFGQTTLKQCLQTCPSDQFSYNVTNLCVSKCPSAYFGDSHLGKCVLFCTQGTFADINANRECRSTCQPGYYADNLTRSCVSVCPTATETTYGNKLSHQCVRVCPTDYWAQNSTKTCVSSCPKHTNGTETYSDNITKYCVQICPYPLFGSNDTHSCVQQCSTTNNQYGHPQGRVCVAVNNCYKFNAFIYYADSSTRTCVQKCPQTLWADNNNFKCVEDCPSNQFRNHHNQICVALCPTDPDEYADQNSKDCVRKCPQHYYSYASTSIRKCINDCSPYSLYKDNSTNRCVSQCPSQPYMYKDGFIRKCVFSCSNNYFSDNRSQSCVQNCPSQWQLFGQMHNFTCVSLCPDGQFADELNSRTCRSTCSSSTFADNITSKCVEHCITIKPYYYQDLSTGTGICVEQCPLQSYGQDINQTCRVQNPNLTSSCPPTYYANRQSHRCVLNCPNNTFANDNTKYCESTCSGSLYADFITRKCLVKCSANYFAYQISSTDHKCLQFCPNGSYAENNSRKCVSSCASKLALPTTNSCEDYCPQPYFADNVNKKCVLVCTPKFADSISRICTNSCPEPSYGNSLNYTCNLICPLNYFGRNSTSRLCLTSCQDGSFADPSLRICVAQCPSYPLLFSDSRQNECVEVCAAPYYGYMGSNKCVDTCPTISGKIYLGDPFNRRCVLECVSDDISFADYPNNLCVALCPNGTFASNSTKECLTSCPTVPHDTFSHNISKICLDVCPLGSYGSSQKLNCVLNCWWPNFADITTHLCVQFCPEGYFSQNSTAKCTTHCKSNTFADPSTHRCVSQCPNLHNLFKYNQNWTCLYECPSGFYADENTRSCLKICNSVVGLYAYQLTNQCLRECPYPYRGYDINHTCILNCPDSYFYNITRNLCTKCPSQCTTCTLNTNCLTCAIGFNLFNGICNISCIPTVNSITYADLTGVCVSECPFTYFGDNSTYTCTKNCPIKQYGDNITRLCLNCPQTCLSCLSYTFCTTCESLATMAIDNMCYKFCNSTHQYYYNNDCLEKCPIGSYSSYTNVYCQSCSTICYTCAQSASNCTSCNNRYHLGIQCLIQCPNGYVGTVQFICAVCNNSNLEQCSNPLTFTTQITVENYNYVVNMQFNQDISIQKQLQDILRVNLQFQRRMLSITDLINNGVPFTYEILPNGLIKLYLKLQDNLQNAEFTVQVTDPTAITAIQTGGTLQNAETLFQISKVQYYPIEQGSQAGTNIAARFTVVFLLLLYAFTFIISDTMIIPLQCVQILALHCLVQSLIPASLFYFLKQLKLSLLQFLPNWLALPLSVSTIHSKSAPKIVDVFIDFNFLRNVGHIFFFIALYVILWFIFLLLSNRNLISNKSWTNLMSNVSQHRFRFMLINDITAIFYVPVLFFGLLQLQELFSPGYLVFNGIMTLMFLISFIIVPIVYLWAWFKWNPQKLHHHFLFLTYRLKQEQSSEIFSEFHVQQIKSNNSHNKQTIPHNSKYEFYILLNYLYILLVVVWMVTLSQFVIAQMSLLILTNLLYIVYLAWQKPYLSLINTIFSIIMIICLIIVETFIIYFTINQYSLSTSQKTQIAKPFLITISIIFMMIILWCVWRCVQQYFSVWNKFTKTQFYFNYADLSQDIERSEQSQKYQWVQSKAIIQQQNDNKPIVGEIEVERINKECNDRGENVIRVKKRILKKKKHQTIQNNNNNQEYKRVNNVNIFDYDYEINHEKVKIKHQHQYRIIDDDIKEEEEEDAFDSSKEIHNVFEEEKLVQVEEDQESISNIDEIEKKQIKHYEYHQEYSQEEKNNYNIHNNDINYSDKLSPQEKNGKKQDQNIQKKNDNQQLEHKQDKFEEQERTNNLNKKNQDLCANKKNIEDYLEEQQQMDKKKDKKLLFLFDFDENEEIE